MHSTIFHYRQATYYHDYLLEYMYIMHYRHLTPLLQGAQKNMKDSAWAAPTCSFPMAS